MGIVLAGLALACAPTYTYDDVRREASRELCPLGSEPACLPAGRLTLESALEACRRNNPRRHVARARIEQARAMQRRTRAALQPTLSFTTEYLQGDAPSAYLFKHIDQRELPPNTDFNDPDWFDNFETGLEARLSIFAGRGNLLRERSAGLGLDMAELAERDLVNTLSAALIEAYFTALAAGRYVAIARETVATVARELEIVTTRYEQGGALKSDLLSMRVRRAQAHEDLIRSENARRLSLLALAQLMGISPATRLDPAEAQPLELDLPGDYDSGIALALLRRADLERVRTRLVQARIGLDIARAGFLPRLDARARAYVDDEDLHYALDRGNWTAALVLAWPLCDGGARRAGLAGARALLQEMEAVDRQAVQAAQVDVRQAYFRLQEATARIAVTRAAVDQAVEGLHLVTLQYEGGTSDITEYLAAELARNRALIRAASAFYDRQKALANLARSLGLLENYIRGH